MSFVCPVSHRLEGAEKLYNNNNKFPPEFYFFFVCVHQFLAGRVVWVIARPGSSWVKSGESQERDWWELEVNGADRRPPCDGSAGRSGGSRWGPHSPYI